MSRPLKKTILLLSFIGSIALLVAAAIPSAAADQEEGGEAKAEPSAEANYTAPKGPLMVPVYPRGYDSEEKPASSDLRDSYIILEDGSVLTMADWVLGALNKDQAGAGMSDYENRLFLGQVARAAVGMEENLVNRSLVHAAPTLSYKAAPPPKGFEKAALSFASLVLGAFFPGTPENYTPAVEGGAFSSTAKTGGGDITTHSDRWHNEAIMHTAGDLKESGTMQIMIKDQKKKLAQEKD